MSSDQIYVKAHYRSRGTWRPKWVAYHHASNTFLQGIRGPVRTHKYPPDRLQFRVALKRYLREMDGEDWADGWTLLAVR